MNILSIQSHVVHGHVGNSAAMFALQRIGHEVWPVHTVQLSNHPGYGSFGGDVIAPSLVASAIAGLSERGILKSCDGIVSGYLGAPEVADDVVAAVARIKVEQPRALYCCDPVLGDDGRLYVSADIAAAIAALAARADVVTPNLFELTYLTGLPVSTDVEIDRAITALHRQGPALVLVTSVTSDDRPDEVRTIVSTGAERGVVATPRLPLAASGAGDLLTALFFAHWLVERDAAGALARAVSAVFGVLTQTLMCGGREMALVAAQDELVAPSRVFIPSRFDPRS